MRAHIEAQRALFAAYLSRYEAIEKHIREHQSGHPGVPFWRMTVRYGILETRAIIQWCDESLEEMP